MASGRIDAELPDALLRSKRLSSRQLELKMRLADVIYGVGAGRRLSPLLAITERSDAPASHAGVDPDQ